VDFSFCRSCHDYDSEQPPLHQHGLLEIWFPQGSDRPKYAIRAIKIELKSSYSCFTAECGERCTNFRRGEASPLREQLIRHAVIQAALGLRSRISNVTTAFAPGATTILHCFQNRRATSRSCKDNAHKVRNLSGTRVQQLIYSPMLSKLLATCSSR